METQIVPATSRRPFGVTVIASAMVINAAVAGVQAYARGVDLLDVLQFDFYFEMAGPVLGALGLIAGVGLWRLQRWAWVATMIWAGANMMHALYGYFWAEPQYVAMVLSVVTVLYLNLRDVQLAFIESTKGILRSE